eukprot:477933_1
MSAPPYSQVVYSQSQGAYGGGNYGDPTPVANQVDTQQGHVQQTPAYSMNQTPCIVTPTANVAVPINSQSCTFCGTIGPPVYRTCQPTVWAWVFFVILLVLFWPLCWIPFLVCQHRRYNCRTCNRPWHY